jgi:hypothetical protein
MKNIRIIHFLIFLLLSGCMQNCEESEPKSELDKLPIPTQEGKRTFGCLVNGEAWVPESWMYSRSSYINGTLYISAGVRGKNQEIRIVLKEQNVPIVQNIYDLKKAPLQFAEISDWSGEFKCYYEGEDVQSGTINITKFDKVNYIVSGTFEFTTVTENCEMIQVTDGRFDHILRLI